MKKSDYDKGYWDAVKLASIFIAAAGFGGVLYGARGNQNCTVTTMKLEQRAPLPTSKSVIYHTVRP